MLLLANANTGQDCDKGDLWSRFYSPSQLPEGFTVLDPFLGGGTSLVEAAKLGAKCIGVDIDPVACFVTQMELTPVDPVAIQAGLQQIEEKVAGKIKALYRSTVAGERVDVIYNFWVDHVRCPRCDAAHDGHPTYQLAHDVSAGTQTVVCPTCGELTNCRLGLRWCKCAACSAKIPLETPPVAGGQYTCPGCSAIYPLHELSRKRLVTPRLFAMEYLRSDGSREFAPTGAKDEALYRKATKLLDLAGDALPIPSSPIPAKGRTDRRPLLYGYRHYRGMFNDRQLYSLGLIAAEIRKIENRPVRQSLALAFSQALATNNMFCGYAFGYRRLTPLFGVHSYRKISRPVEGNVWGLTLGRGSFLNTVRSVITGKEYMRKPYELRYGKTRSPERVFVSPPRAVTASVNGDVHADVRILNQSSANLSNIADRSVDLILTDPPYFDNISYSELSDFYHVWLKAVLGKDYCGVKQRHTPLSGALYAGKRRASDAAAKPPRTVYEETLATILKECFRVTKPEARLIFTFHHRSYLAWASLGNCLLQSGFVVDSVTPVRSEGQSGFHSYEGSLKWDSVFVCLKPKTPQSAIATPRQLTAVAERATSDAAEWRTKIRRSRLVFSDVDEASLRNSFVIREFSHRGLHHAALEGCMALLDPDC